MALFGILLACLVVAVFITQDDDDILYPEPLYRSNQEVETYTAATRREMGRIDRRNTLIAKTQTLEATPHEN